MTGKDYQKAMDCFAPDAFMKNRVRASVEQPAKRRTRRPLRAALIAACVALALLGTAWAAQVLRVRVMQEDSGKVSLCGGIAYYPLERLSEQVQALEGEHTYLTFDSWQELEEFAGVELMENPVLDASPATRHFLHMIEEPYDVSGRFLISTSVRADHLQLYGCYEMENVAVTVKGFLYTDRAQNREDWDERFLRITFREGTQVSQESYTAPSGLEAEILTIDSAGSSKRYRAALTLNGVPYTIETAAGEDEAAAREALIQVLDGFVLD